ncbi:hypothetical protein ABID56_001264 [Alkalibacillus flavidus]|uniref:Uncharacterized protein n=1 Tax=Alkalibacillus flavidus TaxID=546021 RepID=A0ABV2KUC2_9BACI
MQDLISRVIDEGEFVHHFNPYIMKMVKRL